MNDKPHAALFAALDKLLAREKHALLEGAFDKLLEIGAEKTRLLEALEALPPAERAPLKNLQAAAAQNQTLLESALAGIRDVSDRMALIRRLRTSLQTYDAQGKKNDVCLDSPSKLEKRA
ncbi:MAG: flagellar biosynthesis protein FlgN [Rhodobacteraceae bacterium]|nr:flagellar biosynthesis protein FlgN [Paracoccaceae bacterium]MCW9042522.1 flagellar biosynthesis protein FlgN [Pseudopelagicola sp.]